MNEDKPVGIRIIFNVVATDVKLIAEFFSTLGWLHLARDIRPTLVGYNTGNIYWTYDIEREEIWVFDRLDVGRQLTDTEIGNVPGIRLQENEIENMPKEFDSTSVEFRKPWIHELPRTIDNCIGTHPKKDKICEALAKSFTQYRQYLIKLKEAMEKYSKEIKPDDILDHKYDFMLYKPKPYSGVIKQDGSMEASKRSNK